MFMDRIERPVARQYRSGLGYRQFQVKAYIEHIIAEDGIAPSYSMISNALDIEKGNVCRIVSDLERRGCLSRVGAGRVRRIRLPNQ